MIPRYHGIDGIPPNTTLGYMYVDVSFATDFCPRDKISARNKATHKQGRTLIPTTIQKFSHVYMYICSRVVV